MSSVDACEDELVSHSTLGGAKQTPNRFLKIVCTKYLVSAKYFQTDSRKSNSNQAKTSTQMPDFQLGKLPSARSQRRSALDGIGNDP